MPQTDGPSTTVMPGSPSDMNSLSPFEEKAKRAVENGSSVTRSDGRRADSGLTRSGRHPSKSEHYRRLEDRMDELQQQMAITQRMIQDLAETVKRQAREPREPRAAAVRQNFRNLSGRALANMLATSGVGPSTAPSSLPLATTILSAMESTSATKPLPPPPENGNNNQSELVPPQGTIVETPEEAVTVSEAPQRKSSKVASMSGGPRRMSASNPVVMAGERAASRPGMALAIAHATTFVQEISSIAKLKSMGSSLRFKPLAVTGPTITRRFSISSLDTGTYEPREGFTRRSVKWMKSIFKPRVEPSVAPDTIQVVRGDSTPMHPLTIRHDSVRRSMWDSIVLLMIVLDIVITPLSLSFRYSPDWIKTFNAIGNGIFATDFFVNMFSSYTTSHGVLVSGPRRTIRHYLLSVWALADLLSWFPFEVFVSSDRSRFLGVAKVIRLVKVSQLTRRVHSSRKAGIFRSMKLLGTVFIVSHALSCYWNWVADVWRMNEEGYMLKTLGQQYAHCWSLVIGSLNASPPAMYTTIEEVSVAVFMLIGNVLQATVFGSVAVLISSFDEEEVAYNKKLISTYERCRFLDIPEKLARRIQGYYENLYKETRSVSPDADAFINELSPALICEVKFQLYRDMITQIPFLSASNINPVVIEMLILHLRAVIYMQDDVLIRQGEFGDWMGFIGSKGSVGVLDPKSEVRKIIRVLKKGDYFGEMALLQRSKRSTTAIALSWVQIHVLCRNDLDDVKEQYPEQGEILEEEIIKYMKAKVTYK